MGFIMSLSDFDQRFRRDVTIEWPTVILPVWKQHEAMEWLNRPDLFGHVGHGAYAGSSVVAPRRSWFAPADFRDGLSVYRFTDPDTAFAFKMRFG